MFLTKYINSHSSRLLPMGLIVALGDGPSYPAMGTLFWDDGETRC